MEIFYSSASSSKTKRDIVIGPTDESIVTLGLETSHWQEVVAGPFWPCFACPELGDAGGDSLALPPFAKHILNRMDMKIQ